MPGYIDQLPRPSRRPARLLSVSMRGDHPRRAAAHPITTFCQCRALAAGVQHHLRTCISDVSALATDRIDPVMDGSDHALLLLPLLLHLDAN